MDIRGYHAHPTHGNVSVLLFRQRRPGETRDDAGDALGHGMADLRIVMEATGQNRTLVTVESLVEDMLPGARALLREFGQRYPEAKDAIAPCLTEDQDRAASRKRPHGIQGSTLDRVKEVRSLMKEEGISKTKACKRVGIDTRTYDRYADLFMDLDESDWFRDR